MIQDQGCAQVCTANLRSSTLAAEVITACSLVKLQHERGVAHLDLASPGWQRGHP